MDYAVTSRGTGRHPQRPHVGQMYRSYYGPRYDGKVEIKIEEILSKKGWVPNYVVKRGSLEELTQRDAYYEAVGYDFLPTAGCR